MNLVEIRSHDAPKPTQAETEPQNEESKANQLSEEAKGFALTVKESFVDSILAICEQIRPQSFLQAYHAPNESTSLSAEERPFILAGDPGQLVLIADEGAMMAAIDPKQILSWPDFEYILCLVIENRLLRLFQAHLEKQYQSSWKEMDDLLNDDEDKTSKVPTCSSGDKKKKKRRKQKKRNKKCAAEEQSEGTTIAS